MLTMEEELINVFYKVDEELKGMGYQDHHHSQLNASEIITIGIMKEIWHLKTDKSVWRLIHDQFKAFFPQICGYSRLLKRFKHLGSVMKEMSYKLAKEKPNTLKIVDSMPVPLLAGVRRYRSMIVKICQRYRIYPNWGYCAAKKTYYFGFKMMAITEGDKILEYTLVPASTSEQEAWMTLVTRNDLREINVFGDKGFQMNQVDKKQLTERSINFEAIPRDNMKHVVIEDLKVKKRKRKAVETSFSQLVGLFDLTHFVLRTITGFASTIIRKVLTYNISRDLANLQKLEKKLLAT